MKKAIILIGILLLVLVSGCSEKEPECKPYTEICFVGYQEKHLFGLYPELTHYGKLKNKSCFELPYNNPFKICEEGYINFTEQKYGCVGLIEEIVIPCQKGFIPLMIEK